MHSHLLLVDAMYYQLVQRWKTLKHNQILQLVRKRPVLVPQVIPIHRPKQKSRSAMKVDAMTPHHLRNPRQAGVLHLHLPRSAAHQILGPAVVQKSGVEEIVGGWPLALQGAWLLGSP